MRRRLGKALLIVLVVGMATYSLVGYLIAPRVVKHWVEQSFSTGSDQQLVVERVYVNPFTLFTTLRNVTLFAEEHKPIATIRRLDARVLATTVFSEEKRFLDMRIQDLQIAWPSTAGVILIAPSLSVTTLVLDVQKGSATAAVARLEKPELRVTRDSVGDLHPAVWRWIQEGTIGHAPFSTGRLEIAGGLVAFTDNAESPVVRIDASSINGNITRQDIADERSVAVDFQGQLGESASFETSGEWQLTDTLAPFTFNLEARQIMLPRLSPYFVQVAGHSIDAGIANLTLRLKHRNDTVQIDNRIAIDGLRLGGDHSGDRSDSISLTLVVALLTDETDHMELSIPVVRSDVPADLSVTRIIVDSISNRLRELTAMPIEALAALVGHGGEDLASLAFSPGTAEMTSGSEKKIALLAQALRMRPRLNVRARPAYEPFADRDAIAARQVQLHIALATSAAPRDLPSNVLPDFDDPKVRTVLDEFASARLTEPQRPELPSETADRNGDFYRAVYRALVINEPVSDAALRRLARFRARSIINALGENDIESQRLLIADTIDTVPKDIDSIPVQLEVF